MNQIIANLQHAATNLHVSVPVILGAGLQIVPIFAPQYKAQCEAVGAVLASYGIIAAANTPASKLNQ